MGIYDRDYYKDDRTRGGVAGGGLVRVRMLSVTAWLIIINVTIFVIQQGMGNMGVPVHVLNQFTDPNVRESQFDYLTIEGPISANGRMLTNDAQVTAASRRVGVLLSQPLVEAAPGERRQVGIASFSVMDPLTAYGHFSTAKGFIKIEVWRLLTFQFLHGSFLHIFFNMFALWIFGPLVEQQLGRKRYLAFYLTCGIFGGLMYLLLNLIGYLGIPMPGALQVQIMTPLVGASAGVFGVLMACAFIAPRSVVRLLFPPISIQMRWFVYGYFAIAMYNLIVAGHNQGGDAAHVGGALAGYFFIRRPHLLRDFFDVFGDSRVKDASRPGQPRRSGPRSSRSSSARSDAQIDTILDKINRDGLGSLSQEEKRTLADHSRRERED